MLLRNIDQTQGLCNGTRLIVSKLGINVIEAITLNGSHPNQKVLLHRMDMNPSENKWPFHLRRRQFPVSLSFAMTINKSQGQSLSVVGFFLPRPLFPIVLVFPLSMLFPLHFDNFCASNGHF